MSAGGTVNIARDLFDHGVFKAEAFTEREAWIWMIMTARWKRGTYRVGDFVVDLARGQLAASVRFMASAWGWTPSKVQRYLDRLKKMEMILSKTDTGVSVITICNYDKFQSSAEEADTGPIQDRYRKEKGCNKGVIREEDSEANASAASGAEEVEPEDFAKQVFDRAVAFLGKHGTPDRQARSFVGKLRKDHQDQAIFDAFAACSKAGAVDPIPWITARLGKASQTPSVYDIMARIDFGKSQ